MARTDSDRWDLATSVGATAIMVAAQRALASDETLIDDPYAAPLVRAVGIDVYVRLVNGQIPVGGDSEFDPHRMAQGWPAAPGSTTGSSSARHRTALARQ